MARTRLYRDGALVVEDFPVADISDYLGDPRSLVWLDLCLSDGDELHTIVEEFNLHSLAVEDAGMEHQRPKLDRYEEHLFLAAYSTSVDGVTGRLTTAEVSAFITKQALITVRQE